MKLLLDESVPRQLTGSFPEPFEIRTVPRMGWAGTKNGKLLDLAREHRFRALITADKGIEYQQNLSSLPIMVIVLIAHRNTLPALEPLIPAVLELLADNQDPGIYRVAASPDC